MGSAGRVAARTKAATRRAARDTALRKLRTRLAITKASSHRSARQCKILVGALPKGCTSGRHDAADDAL